MTDATVRVAIAISQRTERDGIARTASQPWIAKRIGVGERAVRGCIRRLRERGYLDCLTVGTSKLHGRSRASELRLITPSPNRTADNSRKSGAGNGGSEKAETSFQEPGSAVPPLPSSFQKNLPTNEAGLETALVPLSKNLWPAIKDRLARSAAFGRDKVAMWLDRLTVESINNGVLTLVAPTKFIAREVQMNFERHIVEIWREFDPNARQVKVEHHPFQPRSQEDDDYVDF